MHVVVPYLEPNAAATSTTGFVFFTSFRRNEKRFIPNGRKSHRDNLGTMNLGVPHEHLAQEDTNTPPDGATTNTELADRAGSHAAWCVVRQGASDMDRRGKPSPVRTKGWSKEAQTMLLFLLVGESPAGLHLAP